MFDTSHRNGCLFRALWSEANANIVHQVVKCRLDVVHFRNDPKSPDLAMVMPMPTAYVLFNVMEVRIKPSESLLNRRTVIGVFCTMNEFGDLKNLICLSIGFAEAGVLLIVVVQVKTKFVCQNFEAIRKIVDM